MPHDKNGKLIEVGDFVTIQAVVKIITMQENYCNLTVDTQENMPPYTNPTCLTLNAKQVEVKER